ncbi:hypothetical protein V8E54_003774 [Elaphomyces granulatus]
MPHVVQLECKRPRQQKDAIISTSPDTIKATRRLLLPCCTSTYGPAIGGPIRGFRERTPPEVHDHRENGQTAGVWASL